MATYNRRDVTIRCLHNLQQATIPEGASISVTIADASSPDRTGAAAAEFDFVEVISVPSTYYWAQAMRTAWEYSADFAYDYLVWLNDDVVLDPDALMRLYDISVSQDDLSVVAGAVRDPASGQTTYGAFRFGTGLNRLNMPSVHPAEVPVACDAFNGNVVLVPRAVDRRIGGFPAGYVHGIADYAYGLEARRRGVELVLAPGTVGTCARNPVTGTWVDRSLTASERYRLLRGPKGLPFGPWLRFCWRYGGPIGVASAVKPFLLLGVQASVARLVGPGRARAGRWSHDS